MGHRTHEEAWLDAEISSNRQRAKHLGLKLERSGGKICVTRKSDTKYTEDKYIHLVNLGELKGLLVSEKAKIKVK